MGVFINCMVRNRQSIRCALTCSQKRKSDDVNGETTNREKELKPEEQESEEEEVRIKEISDTCISVTCTLNLLCFKICVFLS